MTRILVLISLVVLPMPILAQGGIGAKAGSQVTANYRLTIGTPNLKQPLEERSPIQVSLELRSSPGVGGAAPIEDVFVCDEGSHNCDIFKGMHPGLVSRRTMWTKAPVAGQPLRLYICTVGTVDQHPGCGAIRGTADATIPVVMRFAVQVVSVTVEHTRALTTDDAWIGIMSDSFGASFDLANCSDGKINQCSGHIKVGSYQDGTHQVSKSPTGSGFQDLVAGGGLLPLDDTSSMVLAFAVFNHGFDVSQDWSGMDQALFDAATHTFPKLAPSGEIDLTDALNDHRWLGCDGPTAGSAFRFSSRTLDQMTRNDSREWILRTSTYLVRSQAGCGASSRYSVVLRIQRSSLLY